MKTFKDLNFNIPPLMHLSIATIYFDNGYGVSVDEDRFSLARTPNIWSVHIIKNGVIGCDTSEIKEVEESGDMGYVSKQRVTEIMKAVQELDSLDRWIKVCEFMPNNKQIVLVKDACNCYHTAECYSSVRKFYSVTVYELKNRESLPIPSVVEWKPID